MLPHHEDRGDDDVPDGRDEEQRNDLVGQRRVGVGHEGQIQGEGDRQDQGGRLEHGDRLVAGGRDDDPHRLRQDDSAQDLALTHAQGPGGLALTLVHRVQARADDLGKVGALVDSQPQDRRDEGSEDSRRLEGQQLGAEGDTQAELLVER